jgi:protein SCO1/2
MNQQGRRIGWLAWGGVLLITATLVLAFLLAQFKVRMVKPLPVLSAVADFTLTNQLGRTVTLADLRGHVWVADFIFTRCPGPCLKMTRQMKDLEQALPAGGRTKLVTLTTDPEFDTPPVLKTYGERFGADPNRWLFLTGAKNEIARLGTDSLKLTAMEKKPEERESPSDLFIHATLFVVVDKQGRMRGVYETTGEQVDPKKVKSQVLQAIKQLERER